MKIRDILNIESNNDGCIHIIRDRLFWVVYELSAYYFVPLLRPYTVHCKYVKSVSRDVVWLGFPDCALSKILDEAMHNGYRVQNISSGNYRFRRHVESSFDKTDMNKEDLRFLNIQSLGVFFSYKPHKVKVTVLGEIIP